MSNVFRLVGPLRPAASASESPVRATADQPQPGRTAAGGRTDATSLRTALARLEQLLKSGTPLRPDAPRGFYLNVVV